jgi:hypothetical protein
MIGRREFITLLGGAVAWPLAARAQSSDRMRRLGVLMGYAESDPEAKGFFAGFMQTLADLGGIDGRNLQMIVRWAPGSVDRMRSFAKELVELQPDVILATCSGVGDTGRKERHDSDFAANQSCARQSRRERASRSSIERRPD